MHDIPKTLNTTPILFGNDKCLIIDAANSPILHDKINHDLRILLEWPTANKITVNPKKSLALILPQKNHQSYPNDRNRFQE